LACAETHERRHPDARARSRDRLVARRAVLLRRRGIGLALLEDNARFFLVLHAVLGAATVATTTHLAVWLLPYARGKSARWRGVRWFSVAATSLYAIQFTLGNLLYPAYKLRVVGHIDAAVAATFDRKEHLVALGLPLLVAASVIAWRAQGREVPRSQALATFFFAAAAAALAWFGAIAGLLVTSYRSIG
jgi:hypothetical protein